MAGTRDHSLRTTMCVTCAALFAVCLPAQRATDAEIQAAAGRFTAPELASRESWRVLEREGRVVALELGGDLPGIDPEGLRIPFADAPRRVRVLEARQAGITLVVAGGVQAALTLIVLRDGGRRTSVAWSEARLLSGLERPLIDGTGRVGIVVYRQAGRVELRALELRETHPTILLARRLARSPEQFAASSLLGDPRVQVRLGNVAAYAPGSEEVTEAAGRAPSFLHPLAALPRWDRVRIDFGELDKTGVGKRKVVCENTGRLPLRLRFRSSFREDASLIVSPATATIAPRSKLAFEVELRLAPKANVAIGRLEVLGLFEYQDPLAELAVFAKRAAPTDEAAPEFDRAKVEIALLPHRRARVVGAAGALRDASPPCVLTRVGGPERVAVASDGAFRFEFPLGRDGRVRVRAEDRIGNKTAVFDLGTLRDREPPVVDVTKIELDLPVRGRVSLRGIVAAIQDDTPPLRVRLRIGRENREVLALVTDEGAFQQEFEAQPGDRVRLVAEDGAAQLNRSREIVVGRVLPYVERRGGDWVLVGPAHARFEVEVREASVGDEPPVVRRRLRGRLDGRGEVFFSKRQLDRADSLAVGMRLAEDGRPLEAIVRVPGR